MKMDRKYWLHRVIVCFLMMIIIIQIPMHAYADEKRMVAIGTNAEYAPFEYLDSNGNLTGFDIELMNAIAKEAGFEVKCAAARRGHRAIHALSLPAACAPETAGEAVARTVQTMLQEREGRTR